MYSRTLSALFLSPMVSIRISLTLSFPIFISLSTALRISMDLSAMPSFSRKVLKSPLWEMWKVYPSTPIREKEWCIIDRISKSAWTLSTPTMSKSHWMNSLYLPF